MKPQPGDIGAVSGVSFLAKAIKFFQRIYKKRENIKTKATFNHAWICIMRNGKECVAEMIPKNGVVGLFVQPYSETYESKKNHIILTPLIPFTAQEIDGIERKIQEYQDRSVRYGFFDILLQIPYSIAGKWLKKKGNDKRLICTELVAMASNAGRKGMFKHPESTNPTEIFENKNYTIKVED